MISKTMLKTALVAVGLIAVINNVGALEPVREIVNGEKSFF